MEGWGGEVGRRLRCRLIWIVQLFYWTGQGGIGRDRAGRDGVWGVLWVRGSWRMAGWGFFLIRYGNLGDSLDLR